MELRQKGLHPVCSKRRLGKKITVAKAMESNKWIDHIYPPSTQEEISEFVDLWEAIKDTTLDAQVEDHIKWRWTQNGEYTTKSAYRIQFEGTFSKMKITTIWRAKAEPKCRFFTWIFLHKKILTANNLIKRGWTDDPICKLCGITQETPTHLCKDCPFAKEVWELVKQWAVPAEISTVSSSGSLYKF
jgi:hypothetical protein